MDRQNAFDTQIARIRSLDAEITIADNDLNRRVDDLYGITEAEGDYYRTTLSKHY